MRTEGRVQAVFCAGCASALAVFFLVRHTQLPSAVTPTEYAFNRAAALEQQQDEVPNLDEIFNTSLSDASAAFVLSAMEATGPRRSTDGTGNVQLLPRDIMGRLKAELKAEMKESSLPELMIVQQVS